MLKEPLVIALMVALVIIAILVVPAGTISVSALPKGSIREEAPKAVATPQLQQQTPEPSVG